MTLRVRGDQVFIRPDALPALSDAGLHLVYERDQSTICGRIVAVGDGPRSRNGTLLPHTVHVGDRVIFASENYQEVHFTKETLLAMAEDDILAVIEESAA